MRLRSLLLLTLPFAAMLSAPFASAADKWIQPTAAELSMTSEPKAPGAPAIYLFREKITEDDLHTFSVHDRVKVFTEAGKDFGNVEIPFVRSGATSLVVTELTARTIHPDGTVVPFTGKPYDKLIVKQGGQQYMARVFSMPDVTPGSILEYRFHLRWDDHVFFPTDWYVQDDKLFTSEVHYLWHPTRKELVTEGREQAINTISWTPILPPGAKVEETRDAVGKLSFELSTRDIPATSHEDHMPPVASFSYRVLFYFSPYRNGEEFWREEGKLWAKRQEHFIGSPSSFSADVASITAGATTQEMKLRAIYAAVSKIENTDYTREHTSAEDKADGLKASHTAEDIWKRKRGSGDQINGVFIAMARQAGFKAYSMSLTRRNRSIFYPLYLSLNQLDDDVSIVDLDGPGSILNPQTKEKELYLDPGVRFCPFGHLAWNHTMSGGLRQSAAGTLIAQTPAAGYSYSNIKRVADLTLDDHGVASGTMTITFLGYPALHWRQVFARNDNTTLRHDLTEHIHELLPANMTVVLGTVSGLEDSEQPLVAHLTVNGPIGTPAGKRLMMPAAFFETNTRSTFPHEKREQAVAFDYAFINQDAVRIKLPPNLAIESLPTSSKSNMEHFAAYGISTSSDATSYTVRRDYVLGEILFKLDEYPALRKFYAGIESTDQQTVVLKQKDVTASTAAAPSKPGN